MYVLEEERDFFRTQVLKLNQEVNELVEQNKRLKQKVFELTDEMGHYKTITFSKLRNNLDFQKKIQKLQLEKTSLSNIRNQTSHQTIERNNKNEESERIKKLHRTLDPKETGAVAHSRVTII